MNNNSNTQTPPQTSQPNSTPNTSNVTSTTLSSPTHCSANFNPQQFYKKFENFGTGLIVASIVSMFLFIGLAYMLIYINMLYFAFGNIFVMLPILLIDLMLVVAFVVSIYFIIVGAKLTSGKYTPDALHSVLIRVAVLSLFWSFFGIVSFVFSLIALNKWLPDYEKALQLSNQNQNPQMQHP